VELDQTGAGIAPDTREGRTLRVSATTGPKRDLEAANTAALVSLVREADNAQLTIDATTVNTVTRTMRDPSGYALAYLVIATAIAYPTRR